MQNTVSTPVVECDLCLLRHVYPFAKTREAFDLVDITNWQLKIHAKEYAPRFHSITVTVKDDVLNTVASRLAQ